MRSSPGGVFEIRLEVLARSTRDLLNILDGVAKAGASFKSLADAWAVTTTPHGKLLLTVLGGLVSSSASLWQEACEGPRREIRPPGQVTAHQRQRPSSGSLTALWQADLARSYGVSEATISRLAAASPFAHGVVGL
jgi:Resolvase, N terminal domain